MLRCEGYRMFRGSATIVPKNGKDPYEVFGDWLYKPEWKCWYCAGSSYPEEIVWNILDYQEEAVHEMVEIVDALEDMVVTEENASEVKRMVGVLKEQMGRMER